MLRKRGDSQHLGRKGASWDLVLRPELAPPCASISLLAEEVQVLIRNGEALTAFGDDGLSGVLATAKLLSRRPGVPWFAFS